jgi:hypothetical protein
LKNNLFIKLENQKRISNGTLNPGELITKESFKKLKKLKIVKQKKIIKNQEKNNCEILMMLFDNKFKIYKINKNLKKLFSIQAHQNPTPQSKPTNHISTSKNTNQLKSVKSKFVDDRFENLKNKKKFYVEQFFSKSSLESIKQKIDIYIYKKNLNLKDSKKILQNINQIDVKENYKKNLKDFKFYFQFNNIKIIKKPVLNYNGFTDVENFGLINFVLFKKKAFNEQNYFFF